MRMPEIQKPTLKHLPRNQSPTTIFRSLLGDQTFVPAPAAHMGLWMSNRTEFRVKLLMPSFDCKGRGKVKSVPLQAESGPEGYRKLRFPDFMTMAQEGGMVVEFMHRPPLPPGNTLGTHFC